MFVYLFSYIYIILSEVIVRESVAFITVLDKGIFPLEKESVGLQFYIDLENTHHSSECKVISWGQMCCLTDQDYKDCSIDTIHGDVVQLVQPKKRETFTYVYPSLYQYDQNGYCDFVVSYKCGSKIRFKDLDVSIPFNTVITNKKKSPYLKSFVELKKCDCDTLDEDSLHECQPVNCDLKYSGRKPFFESRRARCVSAPVCETDINKELPDVVYVPRSNICRDLDRPITLGDVYAISTGLGVVAESTNVDEYPMKVLLKSNCSTISENLILLRDLMSGKLCPLYRGDTTEYANCCTNAILSICAWITAICGILLSAVCCLHTTLWIYKKWSRGELKKTLKTFQNRLNPKKKSLFSRSTINRDVTNNLLRDVIVRDLPIELRDSVVDICQRIDQDIQRKHRYRRMDLGSQINLRQSQSSSGDSSDTSVPYDDDGKKLVE